MEATRIYPYSFWSHQDILIISWEKRITSSCSRPKPQEPDTDSFTAVRSQFNGYQLPSSWVYQPPQKDHKSLHPYYKKSLDILEKEARDQTKKQEWKPKLVQPIKCLNQKAEPSLNPVDKCFMFKEEDFPKLESFVKNGSRHIPKIQNAAPTVLPSGETVGPSPTEEVLNWQIENSLVQNSALTSIHKNVTEVRGKVDHIDTTVKTQNSQVSHMIKVLEERLEGLKYELPSNSSSLANFVLNKEKETQFIQNQIATLRTIGEVPKFDIGPSEPVTKVSPGFGATPIRNWPTPFYFGGVTTPNPSVFFPDQPQQSSKPFDIAQVLKRKAKEVVQEPDSSLMYTEKKANKATKIYDNPLSSMLKDFHYDLVPYISTYSQLSDSFESDQAKLSDSQVSDNEDLSVEIKTIEEEEGESSPNCEGESSPKSSYDQISSDEHIPVINMATKAEVVHPDDTYEEGERENSGASRTQRTNFPKAKGVQIFTIDNIPSEQWEAKFQEFHAWMIVQNITDESHFEILSVFTAHFARILKDWWTSLGKQDKLFFLTRQDFAENINILHLMFIGDVKESRETKRKEFFQMKCLSYDRKDLNKHFKKMTKLFIALGADINLKQAFISSFPKSLSDGAEMFIHNKYGSILNLSIGQIKQAVFLSLDDLCNKRKIIREYLKGDVCLDQACKKPELIIKGKSQACVPYKRRRKFKRFSKSYKDFPKRPFRKKLRYFKRKCKQFRGKKGNKCFIYGKPGHFAKNSPSWGSSQTQAIQRLKQELVNLPTLHIPIEDKKILQTDANEKYWGVVLFEENKQGTKHCCGFASGKFKISEQHYHSTFKEILALRNGIKKFSFFLISHHFLVKMDMGSFPKMLHFKQKSIPHPQLLRWSAWFSQYSFDVKHIMGKKNIVADFFSRKERIPQQVLSCLMFTSVQLVPPDIHEIPYPWEKEGIERIRNHYELQHFSSYDGSILSAFGTNPEYPFCQIFIANPTDFPKELLWYIWCMCHQCHILMKFQNPFFNQSLDQNLQVFLQWFKPLTYWSGLFSTNSNHTLFHFHIPCHLINNQIQSLPIPSAVIYKELTHTILDQDDEYGKAQRYIFQENRCIPPEIWPGPYGSWNFQNSHPYW
ncbi:unnamed protein product [Coffea canephora]|uniref:Reverse transcriptase/retrotransposon-derived protein RNase H-like domain-containing protein n=1 Tax=Coffea canephora TaxID=49390 RepID=A0A068V8P2_COFCA|nr:unnamed protein product [Coffea canephora]